MSPDDLAKQVGPEEEGRLPKADELTGGNRIEAPQSESESGPTSHTANQQTTSHRSHKKAKKRISLPILVASAALWRISLWTSNIHPLVSIIAALAGLALSAFMLRGPRRRSHLGIWVPTAALFTVQIVDIARATFMVISTSGAPVVLLEETLMGVIGVGIAMCLLVTWIPKWPFTESLAVGVVAIFLGALCLPGLQALTQTLQFPPVNGAGMLYIANETADQKITLEIDTDPLGTGTPNMEDITISNDGSHSIKWAFLLAGDATLQPKSMSGESTTVSGKAVLRKRLGFYNNIFVGLPESVVLTPAPGQLFSGTLDPRSFAEIKGVPYGTFIKYTSDRSAVSLPIYGQDVLGNVSPQVAALIKEDLGGSPPTYDPNLTLYVYGGFLQPLESVEQSDPVMSTNTQSPDNLEWTGDYDIQGRYVTVYQNAVDAVTNVMFVFAILLGVAGAGVLGSLQGIIHVLLSRNASGDKSQGHESPPEDSG